MLAAGCGPSAKEMQQRAEAFEQLKASCQQRDAAAKTEINAGATQTATVERDGDALAKAGKPLEAEAKYSEALKELDREGDDYTRLLDKVIKLAATAPDGLSVPNDARLSLKRGMAMLKLASGDDDIAKAEAELDKAIEAAPWWGDAYFNRGLVREKLKEPLEAISDLKVYLKIAPKAKDAEAVGDKIITLEVQAEKTPAKHGRTGKAGIEWVKIPGGSFLMGSNDGEDNERPVHCVTVSPFEMAKTDITVAQYKACVDAGACGAPKTGGHCNWVKGGNYPLNCVDWEQADGYCKWAGGRLPTEAEWERAARGGTDTKWSFGDDEAQLGDYAWYRDNSGDTTHPVGQKKPNQYGLYDMAGNVWQWVADWYDSDYYSNSPESNPTGPSSGTYRVLRGGSWGNNAGRTGYRLRLPPDYWRSNIGFRCAAVSR
jgi:formylglycine-generating enzyme required for sulfatase activity